ncbi:phytoene desaturase family protein [Pseudoteredinibacter isoporae]|uniref:Pyridine nucleotide-disulfide oxidoreductase domain-containing protein 2 n=1 Tax=Pseudoteredinibacter isoporae TaxID=570281 RepID=A0A7X0MXV6_9GAMM|nr:NAD(P)/FAD-dependent oxidoreductase [Pseudoteredinibacter isoporae]MBB6522394.1 phytoene dehydrogenase-like protein [Pseudoteredinibacter isoporae]NHO87927.1 NAD(P)/FAD-dependent oxidoreductase [Pseudoteredinibacter isoporae]NIB23742.1 NAD(P)/FAD-dependent oxidoreductase [Pseudoteredinibacter isoporae]
MHSSDYIIIGSGMNSLVCAALLAKAGHKVTVLERNDHLGGCIKTEEISLPGFKHEVFSAVHPLVVSSPAYAELGEDLHRLGLEYCNNDSPTGVVLPDGQSLVLHRDRSRNIAAMNALSPGDGDRYQAAMQALEEKAELVFGLLGSSLWSFSTLKLLLKYGWKLGVHGMLNFVADAMANTRSWLERDFKSPVSRAMLAPWVLHAGLGPESSFSGLMNQVMAFSIEQTGNPVVKGGNQGIVDAYKALIEEHGGQLISRQDVRHIELKNGKASSVLCSNGDRFFASNGVIANVTPTALYQQLLPESCLPREVIEQAAAYRYGRGMMMIHIAMDEPAQWQDPAMQEVVMLHVTPGLDAVSKAVTEADCGLMPDKATIVVCQPVALDQSRAPDGKWILWIQLQEIPQTIKGDVRRTISCPEDGQWNEEVREAYADRIIEQLSANIFNLKSAMLKRVVYSPKDLENANINLLHGDAYSGVCSLDQFLFWRPLKALKNHQTPVSNVYHIGASTHPGPGLGGGSGYLLAKSLIG